VPGDLWRRKSLCDAIDVRSCATETEGLDRRVDKKVGQRGGVDALPSTLAAGAVIRPQTRQTDQIRWSVIFRPASWSIPFFPAQMPAPNQPVTGRRTSVDASHDLHR
jgi:hypothetical protein